MIFSMCFYISVMLCWGIPIALFGVSFWQVSIVWGVIMLVGWAVDLLTGE